MSISLRTGDDEARADAGISLGDAFTAARVDDVHGEGVMRERR